MKLARLYDRRRVAIGAICLYFVILVASAVIDAMRISYLVPFEAIMAAIIMGALGAMGAWAYCYRCVISRKDVHPADRRILSIAIFILNLPACLIFLHDPVLSRIPGSDQDAISRSDFRRATFRLILLSFGIFFIAFAMGMLKQYFSDQ